MVITLKLFTFCFFYPVTSALTKNGVVFGHFVCNFNVINNLLEHIFVVFSRCFLVLLNQVRIYSLFHSLALLRRINTFPACGSFCSILVIIADFLDPDQA